MGYQIDDVGPQPRHRAGFEPLPAPTYRTKAGAKRAAATLAKNLTALGEKDPKVTFSKKGRRS